MVECHRVTMTRAGQSTTLEVPLSVLATNDKAVRLFSILTRERTQLPILAAVRSRGSVASEREVHTAELLFVRDGLGPLRHRAGPIPEKVGACMRSSGLMCRLASPPASQPACLPACLPACSAASSLMRALA